MKNISLIIVVLFVSIFLTACSGEKPLVQANSNVNKSVSTVANSNTSITPAEDLTFQVAVDIDNIHTLDDYTKAKAFCLDRYNKRKSAALKDYNDTHNAAMKEYNDFETAELNKLRSANYSAYLEWLDAEKTGNYTKKKVLLDSFPELKAYEDNTSAKFKQYQKTDKEAFERYMKIDKNAFATYTEEDKLAYKAYTDSKKL